MGVWFYTAACLAIVVGTCHAVVWLGWAAGGRDAALRLGLVRPPAVDYLVRGQRAERDGRYADTLDCYEEAMLLDGLL